jgi:DNA (cytosine-5)-methyltransferase 1
MKVLSLFSGGGLGDYGLELAGMEIVGQVEIDDYCQKILKLRWPNVPKWKDIREVKGNDVLKICGTVDLISGGFPCQPFSVAGKRRGKQDDRYLWPEMLRVISEVKSAWILGENVPGIIKSALDTVLSDLESLGYAVQAFTIPACAVDAPHRRDRVWIVGYSKHNGLHSSKAGRSMHESSVEKEQNKGIESTRASRLSEDVADTERTKFEGKGRTSRGRRGEFGCCRRWPVEPGVGRVANGIANRVDRLKLLGNGQVVQVVEWIGERIMEFEATLT